jgi:hypothetical protein
MVERTSVEFAGDDCPIEIVAGPGLPARLVLLEILVDRLEIARPLARRRHQVEEDIGRERNRELADELAAVRLAESTDELGTRLARRSLQPVDRLGRELRI